MKKENRANREKKEIYSLNENVYDMFSVEELEKRLQMSALAPWVCGTHDNHPPPEPICATVLICNTFEVDPLLEP